MWGSGNRANDRYQDGYEDNANCPYQFQATLRSCFFALFSSAPAWLASLETSELSLKIVLSNSNNLGSISLKIRNETIRYDTEITIKLIRQSTSKGRRRGRWQQKLLTSARHAAQVKTHECHLHVIIGGKVVHLFVEISQVDSGEIW